MILQWSNLRKFLMNVKITRVWYKYYLREKVVGGVWIFEVEKKIHATIDNCVWWNLLSFNRQEMSVSNFGVTDKSTERQEQQKTSNFSTKSPLQMYNNLPLYQNLIQKKKIKLSFSRNWLIQVVLSSIVLKYIWCIDLYGPKCNITLKRQYCSK